MSPQRDLGVRTEILLGLKPWRDSSGSVVVVMLRVMTTLAAGWKQAWRSAWGSGYGWYYTWWAAGSVITDQAENRTSYLLSLHHSQQIRTQLSGQPFLSSPGHDGKLGCRDQSCWIHHHLTWSGMLSLKPCGVLLKISTPPCTMQELIPAGSCENFLKAHFFTHSTYPLPPDHVSCDGLQVCPFPLTFCHVAAICWLFLH